MKKKILTIGLTVVVVLVVLIVVLMGNLGKVIELSARTFLPKLTESEVQLAAVDIKPLRGQASIEGLVIGNPEGYKSKSAIQFSEFKISLDTATVSSDKIHIYEVIIKDPKITYELGLGNSNIGTIIKNMEKNLAVVVKEKAETEEAKAAKKVMIDTVRVEGAMVVISSKLTQGVGAPIPLPVIELKDLGKDTPEGVDGLIAFTMVLKKLSTAVFVAVKDAGAAVVGGAADAGAAVVGGAADAAGEVVGGAGKAVGGAVDKAAGGLKGLFGGGDKKEEPAE